MEEHNAATEITPAPDPVVATIVSLAKQARSQEPQLDPSYLIWRATDEAQKTHPNISEAQQQAAFTLLNESSSILQRAYHAALDLQTEHPQFGEVAAKLGGYL